MCIDNIEFSTNSDRILKKDINILIYIIIKCLFSQCIFEGNVEKSYPHFLCGLVWITVEKPIPVTIMWRYSFKNDKKWG